MMGFGPPIDVKQQAAGVHHDDVLSCSSYSPCKLSDWQDAQDPSCIKA